MQRKSMYPVCSVNNLDFWDFVEQDEVDYGESMVEEAEPGVTDPPYNLKQVR